MCTHAHTRVRPLLGVLYIQEHTSVLLSHLCVNDRNYNQDTEDEEDEEEEEEDETEEDESEDEEHRDTGHSCELFCVWGGSF